ncbi:MAG: MaoC family dehydratase [Firmicutes bacterium]|nr:MaoC family dehydratase [Bacillota bacterium]
MKGFTLEEIKVGQTETFTKTFTLEDVELFGKITGDLNPAHMDEEYAKNSIFKKRIVHGMFVGALFSTIFGVKLPGLGSIYTKQSLKFTKPVFFGDTINAKVTVKEIISERNRVVFECVATNQYEECVVLGEAEIMPPR